MEFWSNGDLETSGGLSNVKKESRRERIEASGER